MTERIKKIAFYWMPVIVWMAVIFAVSSIYEDRLPHIDIISVDKIFHFSEYFVFGILLFRAFLGSRIPLSVPAVILLSIILASAYAVADECHQYFVQGRSADFFDFLADFAGLNMGIILYKKRSGR